MVILQIPVRILPECNREHAKHQWNCDAAAAADQQRVGELQLIFDAWAAESHPEWYTAAADPLQAGVSAPTGS